MSSSNTDSENSFEYEDSDGCYVSEYDIAFEDGDLNDTRVTPSKSEESVDSLDQIYADEPMADEDWMKAYEKEQEENAKLERMLEERLNGTTRVDVWCLCGNCDRQLLQNLSECYCCKELEGCEEALEALDTELVYTCVASRTGNSLVWCTVSLATSEFLSPSMCLHIKIRKQFPAAEEETFTGFDLDEEH
ncbi:uncharacterized protein [Montipora foliosa]|uniref:uncharacterized protein n=1 Tax=Montipora foliosa TaxID=591990 RepID=UPI0035F120FE